MSELIEKAIRDAFPEAVIDSRDNFGVLNIKIDAGALLGVCEMLKSAHGFDYLADVTAIDWKDRIEVVYQLTALVSNTKIALRVDLDANKPEVDSVVSVWKGANYQEREVFDLMGVVFKGHPDLRRILLPEDWEGHPLRKDYVIPD
ncbi:MAG: NADH-quinone oxidoreductase subunit C [Armatimonadetes bacterium]|nr:NADH-quinone oxidoreductase subunit C [Armatimonadota bacterium]